MKISKAMENKMKRETINLSLELKRDPTKKELLTLAYKVMAMSKKELEIF